MTKARKKCYCPIGMYWHSSYELVMFDDHSQRDGLFTVDHYFKFCPYCGKKITKKMQEKGLEEI